MFSIVHILCLCLLFQEVLLEMLGKMVLVGTQMQIIQVEALVSKHYIAT